MKLNKKGFTVIELLMSFIFSSILAITLFSVIISYRSKQTDSSIETDLLAFKSHLIMDIQEDIQLRGLKEINYCMYDDDNDPSTPETAQPRCVVMGYNDNVYKELKVAFDLKIDVIKNKDGTTTDFPYNVPYIMYGDIRYDIPDAGSVYIDDDYILTTSSLYDGLETGTKLYKINFNLKHNDLDTDINISLVANGTMSVAQTEGNYERYSIGDRVLIQIHGQGSNPEPSKNTKDQLKFRVIKNSNKQENSLVLLFDDDYDNYFVLPSTQYNVIDNVSNKYETSSIKSKVHALEMAWGNADEVRLISTEEIARIASLSPQFRGVDSADVNLTALPTNLNWLFYSNGTSKNYWTMSEKLVTGNDNGKKVWYVDSGRKILTSDFVNTGKALRPVIVIRKSFVLHRVD